MVYKPILSFSLVSDCFKILYMDTLYSVAFFVTLIDDNIVIFTIFMTTSTVKICLKQVQ